MKRSVRSLVVALLMAVPLVATAVDLEAYLKKDSFDSIKISPTGEYLAATVPLEDRTALVILQRSDNAVTGRFTLGRNTHVSGFSWVNDERLLITVAEKSGALAQPRLTGELYAINADGSGADILVGARVGDATLGTRIQPKKAEMVAASLLDDLPQDDKHVLITVRPFVAEPYSQVDRMDVYTGRRQQMARAPVRDASFLTDNEGKVRFAAGSDTDNQQEVYYRDAKGSPWQLIHSAGDSGLEWQPLGFAADNATAYFIVDQPSGPDAIVAYDIASGTRKTVLRDEVADPSLVLLRNGTNIPVGALFDAGKPRTAFIDETSGEARLYRSLEAAFGDVPVLITSYTADGNTALVHTWSDTSPGDFYLFDIAGKKAAHLLSRREWFDPDAMNPKTPIRVKARDGLDLHGYLTVPRGTSGRGLPMVVMPHGGPYGIQDGWGFDGDVQMLADAGYAVLQLNFRGSGGYGDAFQSAGAREWGGAMQDDLTDATRWAIAEGIATPDRICIYGSSYGGYAALMGVAKEADLYRCAAGNVGVYDLPIMQRDDSRDSNRLENWSREWVGEGEQLALNSPNRVAERIRVPVFLAAGHEDRIAPIAHTELMEKALRQAGVPVEALYFRNEGHGYYLEENRREYYTRLLAFLSRHLGGRTASTSSGGAEVAE